MLRSSEATFVELFHFCLLVPSLFFTVKSTSCLLALGGDSGVMLWLYLCPGRSGVTGPGASFPRKLKTDCRWGVLLVIGAEDGSRDKAFMGGRGVPGADGLPVIFRANLRNGDMDLDNVLDALGALLEVRETLAGVAR